MSESSRKHKAEALKKLDFSLVICSTSRFARLKLGNHVDDASGDLIAEKLREAGHTLVSRTLVPDDKQMIREAVKKALRNDNVAAVIVCGGTGIAPQDMTIETLIPMFRKILPGFGELFRKLSYDLMGSAAIMSRAIAGTVDGKVVFCIPGSIDAVRLCLDKLILPETAHIVKHAREKS